MTMNIKTPHVIVYLTATGISFFKAKNEGNEFLESFSTESVRTNDGLREFLLSIKKTFVSIVVDVVEEEFCIEKIAATKKSILNKIISRKLDNRFSSNRFKNFYPIKNNNKVKKNKNTVADNETHYLFSSLQPNDCLDYLIDRLLEQKNAIKGIFSCAFVMAECCKQSVDLDKYLVVGIQDSSIRFSWGNNGIVLFS